MKSTVMRRGSRESGAAVLCRSIAAVAVMLLLPASAWPQAVPLPMDKPNSVETPSTDAGEKDASARENPEPVEPPAAVSERGDPPPSSCLGELQEAGVVADRAAAFIGSEQCAIDDPVTIEAVHTRNGRVSLPGRPTLDCPFAAVLADWMHEVVSPVATSLLGAPADALITGPGHQCRNRAQGKLSEHAIGNAVDILAVRLVDGRNIIVERMPDAEGAERTFLRAISASACGYFTTVLGPGSDAAHADHLHVDLAERRTAEYRICMAR